VATCKRDRVRARRRTQRVRSRLGERGHCPRISVFRSLNHIYAQLHDDAAGVTIASCSSLVLKDVTGDKKAVARAVGLELAKRAKEKGIEKVVFDRGRFLYHGRVRALADGAREGGLSV